MLSMDRTKNAALLALIVLFALVPSVACAASLNVVPDYRKGTVALRADYDSPCSEVKLFVGGELKQTIAVDASDRSVETTSVLLRARTSFTVTGSYGGAPDFSASITLDPASYRPRKPTLPYLPSGRVVSRLVDVYSTNSVPFTSVKLRTASWDAWRSYRLSSAVNRHFVDDMAVFRGPIPLQVVHINGFGSGPACTTYLYWVGSVPTTTRSVVIDKQFFALYHIYNRRVVKWWPVAVGKLNTPTPSGDFKLGAPAPSGGAWGVLRRRLYRTTGAATMYYIHGTNEPWSIGTNASHGCVRMYNTHVVQFARTVPNGTRVRIH